MLSEAELNLIKNVFDGDKNAFLDAHANGRSQTKKWQDIVAATKVLPELEMTARELIAGLLGYLPPDHILITHEPSLRALMQQYRMGDFNFESLLCQGEEHIKLIRNADVTSNTCLSYERDIYHKYFYYLPQYADAAKDRLTMFLGYEPKLEHSLVVEMLLRETLASDKAPLTEKPSTQDLQAMTIIKYREVLLAKGKSAADASPLPAMELLARNIHNLL